MKELRSNSPTKELGLQVIDNVTSKEGDKKKKKRHREYSEGEWSSDSDDDSLTSEDDWCYCGSSWGCWNSMG